MGLYYSVKDTHRIRSMQGGSDSCPILLLPVAEPLSLSSRTSYDGEVAIHVLYFSQQWRNR